MSESTLIVELVGLDLALEGPRYKIKVAILVPQEAIEDSLVGDELGEYLCQYLLTEPEFEGWEGTKREWFGSIRPWRGAGREGAEL